jgi:hypothetical protein
MRLPSLFQGARQRRYDSALIVLLALNLFERLSPVDQQNVEHVLIEVFRKRAPDPYTAWRDIVGPSSDLVAILRGIAMAKLELPTGIDGLDWRSFVPSPWLRNPLRALHAFRRFDPATDEAADFLRSKGLALAEPSDHGARWMDEMRTRYP